jgi:hypothetical protein
MPQGGGRASEYRGKSIAVQSVDGRKTLMKSDHVSAGVAALVAA